MVRPLRAFILIFLAFTGSAAHPRIKVSDNHRFLVYDDGRPFFYLGDTAWELFHRLKREEAERYLRDRAAKGFTVIQAVAIAELDGHTDPNPYGHLPLTDLDPARPAVKEGPNNDYWDHVDWIIEKANELELTIGFLPTWGRYWHDQVKDGNPLFDEKNAATYGQWLGQRYKEKNVIWILGGDRAVENEQQKAVIRAMARGLRTGDGGGHLITFHPPGGNGSSSWFHNDDWLDFNMRQNGHQPEFTGRYDSTHADYARTPPKPVIDAEPIYEDHPVSFNPDKLGHSVAADVRRPFYWDLFGGAFGHTYGHHSVWQMYDPARGKPINRPLMSWSEALDQPGAKQMQFGRRLIESRPFLTRIPDDSLIVKGPVVSSVPGTGTRHFAATRDETGSFAMIYVPVGRPFKVRIEKLQGPAITAWWYNPRDGSVQSAGKFSNTEEQIFAPPTPGELLDWVLVLDDASKNYPPPGQIR